MLKEFTWCGYKITGFNFFPLPCKLGNREPCVVLACALPFILGYNFKVVRQTVWHSVFARCGSYSCSLMFSVNVEQRINVKICVKLGKSATETYDLLKKVYGDECLSRTQVFEWFKRFKEWRKEIGDDQRPARPSTSKTDANVEKVGEMFRQNRRLSIRAVAELVKIDKEVCDWRLSPWLLLCIKVSGLLPGVILGS
jgi:hypothetical protein